MRQGNLSGINNATPGDWSHACDSYGKVQHSRKACVYTSFKDKGGERLVSVASRVANWTDARLMAAAKDLYDALKYMNHVEHGYCTCPLNDGMRPDEDHATSCADARRAIRKVESHHAMPNEPDAEAEWMNGTAELHS